MTPKPMSMARRLAWGVVVTLACLPAARGWARYDPAGRTVYVGCGEVGTDIFDSPEPVRGTEAPKRVTIFDQSLLPSTYETCYVDESNYQHLKIMRPLDKASFPRNIAPPKFVWQDPVNNLWMLTIKPPGWKLPLRVVTDRLSWRPDFPTWDAIKEGAGGGRVDLEVRGSRVDAKGRRAPGDPVYADATQFKVSKYPCDPLLVIRLVTPLFHGYKTPDIIYRDLSTFERQLFLPGKGVYCTNCHVFPGSPDLEPSELDLAIAVRDQLVPETSRRILGLYNFAAKDAVTLNVNSFFMSWDPEGKKIAVTRGNVIFSLPLITLETQEFYILNADIEIVDKATRKVAKLPGASEGKYMESFPSWSPDGKTIVFARAPETDPKVRIPRAKFNLYKVPYNDGEGGKPEPMPGASHNGMSNFAPRFSPNGKWIVFNKADWASLVKPTADLWIVSTQEGAMPHALECNSDRAMDSHHSWSANSRWLVYTSKSDDGIFTRPRFTEIDDDGHASPPVTLPILDEETLFCFNVPEFLRFRMPIDAEDIVTKTSFLKSGPEP